MQHLWHLVPLLDEMTIEFINSKGGLKAMAFSHPHFYSNMNDWANTFNCPIYIHENDVEHIMLKGPNVKLWKGDEWGYKYRQKMMPRDIKTAKSYFRHANFRA